MAIYRLKNGANLSSQPLASIRMIPVSLCRIKSISLERFIAYWRGLPENSADILVDELTHRTLLRQCGKKWRPSENPQKSGAKPHDCETVDDETLPLVRDAIKKLWGDAHNRPQRVTVTEVEKMLGLPSKRISTYLPKFRAEVLRHQESQEQNWSSCVGSASSQEYGVYLELDWNT